MAGEEQLASIQKGGVTNLAHIATVLGQVFPRIVGTFTLAAATVTVVTQPATAANSVLIPFATNGTAALTVRSLGLFHSANTPGASFSVSTQGGAAAGSETFEYILVNPS
jgi:hypothetical protein